MPTEVESPRCATAVHGGALGAVVAGSGGDVVGATVVSVDTGTSEVDGLVVVEALDVVDASVEASVEPAAQPASNSAPSVMASRRTGRGMNADDPTLDAGCHAYRGQGRAVPKIR
jgi:hypothetical protein